MIKDKITRSAPLGGQAKALEGTLNGRHREDAVQTNSNRQRSKYLALLTPSHTDEKMYLFGGGPALNLNAYHLKWDRFLFMVILRACLKRLWVVNIMNS